MKVLTDQELENLRKEITKEMEEVRNDLTLTKEEKYHRSIELGRKLGKAFFIKWGKIPPDEED